VSGIFLKRIDIPLVLSVSKHLLWANVAFYKTTICNGEAY